MQRLPPKARRSVKVRDLKLHGQAADSLVARWYQNQPIAIWVVALNSFCEFGDDQSDASEPGRRGVWEGP
ncbi:hypothetical protein D3C72_2404050 [compost metagenome]